MTMKLRASESWQWWSELSSEPQRPHPIRLPGAETLAVSSIPSCLVSRPFHTSFPIDSVNYRMAFIQHLFCLGSGNLFLLSATEISE